MDEGNGMADISLTRMYASADGETHFEDVVVKTTRVAIALDVPAGDMASPAPVTELTFLRMDAGYARDWHPAPRRQFVFVSAGEVELEVSDGERRRFGPGSVVLAEDTTGKGHQTRAGGTGPSLVIWVACA